MRLRSRLSRRWFEGTAMAEGVNHAEFRHRSVSIRARAVLFCLALIVVAVLCSTRVASEAGQQRAAIVARVAEEDRGRPRAPLRSDAGLEPEPPRFEPLPFDAGGPPPPHDAGAPKPLAWSVRQSADQRPSTRARARSGHASNRRPNTTEAKMHGPVFDTLNECSVPGGHCLSSPARWWTPASSV